MTVTLLQSALSINNSGVSLLEHGHFREAQRTFRDALLLMKQHHVMQNKKPATAAAAAASSASANCPAVADTMLQSVASRLVQAQAKPIYTVFDIRAIEHSGGNHDDLFIVLKSAIQYGPSSSLAYPIRIRSSCSTTSQQPGAMQKSLMAMVLYNQALSHLLSGQGLLLRVHSRRGGADQPQLPSSLLQHLNAALSCLQVAHAVLSQHLSSPTLSSSSRGERACSMLLQAMIVNNLVQVLQTKTKSLSLVRSSAQEEEEEARDRRTIQEWLQQRDQLLSECDLILMETADDEKSVAAVVSVRQFQCFSPAAAA